MSRRPAQLVHPAAWWLWAVAIAAAVSRVGSPVASVLVLASLAVVVAARRNPSTVGHPFATALRFGCIVAAVRVAFGIVFAQRGPGRVLFSIPALDLPSWFHGISLGGPVTAELLLNSFYRGLVLCVVLACFGAAAEMASPVALLASMPNALYELGVTMAVAVRFVPELGRQVRDLRAARRLRGRPSKGWRGMRGLLVPLLDGALERAVALAATMEARGFGACAPAPSGPAARWRAVSATLGTALVAFGLYGLLSSGASLIVELAALLGGGALLVGLIVARGRRVLRTRYRRQAFDRAAVLVASSGVFAGAVLWVWSTTDPVSAGAPAGLAFPALSPWALLTTAAVLACLVVSPPPAPLHGARRVARLVEATR